MTLKELVERFKDYDLSEIVVANYDEYIAGIIKESLEVKKAFYVTDGVEHGKIVLIVE